MHPFSRGNPNRGLANGGLARKAPNWQLGQKEPFRGNFCSFPVTVRCGRKWSRSAPKNPRWGLKRPQSAPKRPDLPGPISPRFSLKIWGLSRGFEKGCSFFAYSWKLPAYSGTFFLTVDTFSFFTYSWSFFAYSFSFLAYSWSFFAYSGKVRLIRALRDCKQRSSTVSKKAPTVSKKASPFEKGLATNKPPKTAKTILQKYVPHLLREHRKKGAEKGLQSLA